MAAKPKRKPVPVTPPPITSILNPAEFAEDPSPLVQGPGDEVLNRKQLMAWLGIGHNALHQLLDAGLPVVRAGNRWLFVKRFVMAWLWDQSHPAKK